jgi:threonine dehydratase
MTLSWQQGRPIETEEADTVADGIATRVPIPEALAVMSRTVDDMRLASETDILTARDELQAALPVAVEPSAAVGWAAARQTGAGDGAVAVILSGGNVPLTEG